ncbi:MAG TPA: lipoate-protein ligase B [Propionibacteriaceae bacterium]|nr:lipoate-protein ligase B [Propionibacteriaceae bacterium]
MTTAIEYEYLGLNEGSLTEYHTAWQHQRDVHAQVAAGSRAGTVIYVEHPPVYTAGRRTEPHERPQDGTPVVDVDRGGKITYHGPGQLVGYPIVTLPGRVGVVDYVRRLEEALIRLLADYGISTGRVPDRTGVWLAAGAGRPERKIAAIGIRVSKRTTMHGFALNVSSHLDDFDKIVPCGIADAGVTSVAAELSWAPSLAEVGHDLEPYLDEYLAFEPFVFSPDLHDLTMPVAPIRYGLSI